MKAFAAFLLLCLTVFPAAAEDPAKGCAPVYGTWRTAYVMDKFGNPQPLEPAGGRPGLIMEARIDEKSAVLVWHGGKKKVKFERWDRYRQDSFDFGGVARNNKYIEVTTRKSETFKYPFDNCYLDVWIFADNTATSDLEYRVLMVHLK
ncbi:MAG: hypothetical protein AB1918_10230 [Pseudomonadota bacterium]